VIHLKLATGDTVLKKTGTNPLEQITGTNPPDLLDTCMKARMLLHSFSVT
jgi:hypothetical protein